MATESVRIPGLGDLLAGGLSHPDPATAEQAAENVLTPVILGIEASGELLTCAAGSKDPTLSMDALSNTGYLLKHLAELAHRLHDYKGLQRYQEEFAAAIAEERADKAA